MVEWTWIIRQVQDLGAVAVEDEATGLLHLNGELRVSIVLCRHRSTVAGGSRWVVRLDGGLKPDITIAVRMDATNEAVRDYYLLPGIDMTWQNLRMAEENGIYLDAYRFESLAYFVGMAERVKAGRNSMKDEILMIPIDQIRILNPRHRKKRSSIKLSKASRISA